jgi:hypothetical protein
VKSQLAKRLLLLGSVLTLGLVVLELAVRLIEPRKVLRSYFTTSDPILNHKFIPGAHGRFKTTEFNTEYVINSLGLRDREISRTKPPGVRRILMLGDSFTEGNGIEASETFSSLLQTMIDRASLATRWEVINTGVGSYSPLLEYLYLKTGGLDLDPDLVILNFDLSDVYDDLQYTALAKLDASGDPVAVGADVEPPPSSRVVAFLVAIKDFAKEHLRLYNFLRRRLVMLGPKPDASGDIRVDKYAMLRGTYQGKEDAGWGLTYGYLLRIREILKAHGIDFWVTVYPYGLQVSPREWRRGRLYWGFEAGKVYSAEPQRWVERFCRRQGINAINMYGDFKALTETTYPVYFDLDGHWRPVGHELAAKVLFRSVLPYLRKREAGSAH